MFLHPYLTSSAEGYNHYAEEITAQGEDPSGDETMDHPQNPGLGPLPCLIGLHDPCPLNASGKVSTFSSLVTQ